MPVTVSGNVISVNPLTPENKPDAMEDKLLGSLTETRLLSLKAKAPIEVTESGISKLRIADRLKALSPILVRESGNSIAVREVELLKALLPIEMTDSSSVTFSNFLQSENPLTNFWAIVSVVKLEHTLGIDASMELL
tara:strand:- start:107 stop:517 length:411 start_codon:yes stop_codon:yes gene_type:complete